MLEDVMVKSLMQFWSYCHATALINLHVHVNMLIAFLKHGADTQTCTCTYKR